MISQVDVKEENFAKEPVRNLLGKQKMNNLRKYAHQYQPLQFLWGQLPFSC